MVLDFNFADGDIVIINNDYRLVNAVGGGRINRNCW